MQYQDPEIVICSAVRALDGKIVRGHRHHDAIRALHMIPGYEKEHCYGKNGEDQGFMTSRNRYVTRREGCQLQQAAGIPSILPFKDSFLHGELYSEDLY